MNQFLLIFQKKSLKSAAAVGLFAEEELFGTLAVEAISIKHNNYLTLES